MFDGYTLGFWLLRIGDLYEKNSEDNRFMRPSDTWFPTSLAARAAWFANFAVQFALYAATLGLSSYTMAVSKDDEDFQSIAATRLAANNFNSAVADFLRELTEGVIGSPQPVFPSESFTAPPNDVPAGIFQRLDELRTLIMAQPTYTEAMGTAMGIEPSGSGGDLPPELIEPEIDCHAAASGYQFTVTTKYRHQADQWQVYIAEVGTTNWRVITVATGGVVEVQYVPAAETTGPVQLQVRVQLRKGNQNYGQPSDIALVTVNP